VCRGRRCRKGGCVDRFLQPSDSGAGIGLGDGCMSLAAGDARWLVRGVSNPRCLPAVRRRTGRPERV
ncbi:MAG: hypothetical protein PVG29_06070, partial [Gammaproteobacteria bacterium]